MDQTRKTHNPRPIRPLKRKPKWQPSNTCVMCEPAKQRPHHQEPQGIRMGPFDLRTIIRAIQWSSMQCQEDRGSTSRPKNTKEECVATYSSNAPNRDIQQRHVKGRPTAKKERPGNQKMKTKNNGDHQPKPGKWRSQKKQSRKMTKVPSKQ